MNLAVIPARGGSKRIPRKNIKPFCGKPMIGWSIEAAIASGCFDRILVSTDDEEVATVAKSFGAEVPFVRPPELSDDHTGTVPVVSHAVRWCADHWQPPNDVCCIYATAPFIAADDLVSGLDLLRRSSANYAFTVTTFASPIQRALRITDGGLGMFHPELYDTRSQDLEEAYHDAAQFYWGTCAAWIDSKPLFQSQAVPILLPRHRVQDIDTQEDWDRAELMFEVQRSSCGGTD